MQKLIKELLLDIINYELVRREAGQQLPLSPCYKRFSMWKIMEDMTEATVLGLDLNLNSRSTKRKMLLQETSYTKTTSQNEVQ